MIELSDSAFRHKKCLILRPKKGENLTYENLRILLTILQNRFDKSKINVCSFALFELGLIS